MCALSELLHKKSVQLSGSDSSDVFYTDAVLKRLGIPYFESFRPDHISEDVALVIYSAAYDETNVELAEAKCRGIPVLSYTQALGEYSVLFDSAGIAGVHGKTTTTAIAGTLARAAGIRAQVLAGSAVSAFNDCCTLDMGDDFFIAETCEYRRHFMNFHPHRIVLTSVETDHQDYYPDYESIRDAFVEYAALLPPDGEFIYCADDDGAREVAEIFKNTRNANWNGRLIPYGFNCSGEYHIEYYENKNEKIVFKLTQFEKEWILRIPGKHNVLNAAAAIALVVSLAFKDRNFSKENTAALISKIALALEDFKGSKRRAEILGEACGILFMDDYGHHPTAIQKTLRGLKEFYPDRRLAVSFMPHTYTRTVALLNDFAGAFDDADILLLHKIYPSARESYSGGVNGQTLFEETKNKHNNVIYIDEPLDAVSFLKENLKEGDLFLTLGAGDNWRTGKYLYDFYKGIEA